MRTSRKAREKPSHHRRDAGLPSTMELIFSVTDVKVYPGWMTGGFTRSPVLGSTSAAMSLRLGLGRFQRLVGVCYGGEVGRPRPGVQRRHQAVVERRVLQPRHRGVGLVDAAEDDGAGRARLLARRPDFEVADVAALVPAPDLGLADALDAVGAFLHDAAAAAAHVRVSLQLEAGRAVVGVVIEEVEAPDLVGAVVGAVARADAAVVDHLVEAVGAVDGGLDGADL